MEKSKIRELFPYLKTGKIYFNHASISPMPANVAEEVKRYAAERSAGEINNYKQFLIANLRAKKKLAELLNCSADDLAWGNNVGSAMSILAAGLEWEKGDRIILDDIEFPSNVYPFMNLKNKGVEINFVKSHRGILKIEDYEKLITPKTKLISVSLVQFLSGYKIDIGRLSKLCEEKNIILSVDAIQAAGAVKIDLTNHKIDFLAGGVQKWLFGMQGLSYFYVSHKLQNLLKPVIIGWQSVINPWSLLEYNLSFPDNADKYLSGTLNVAAIFSFNKALDIFLNYGPENVYKDILNNTNFLLNRLASIGLRPLLLNEPEINLGGIVSVKVPNPDYIKKELLKENIVVETREGILRISPHFYNTAEEIETLITKLKKII